MEDLEFKLEVTKGIARLEEGVVGVHQRLDRLNGKVAEHERRIGEHDMKFVRTEASEKSGLVETYIKPNITTIVAVILVLLLNNAGPLLAVLGK